MVVLEKIDLQVQTTVLVTTAPLFDSMGLSAQEPRDHRKQVRLSLFTCMDDDATLCQEALFICEVDSEIIRGVVLPGPQ